MQAEVEDFGYCVQLHCSCMSSDPKKLFKPWDVEEFDVLSEPEYQLLVRYHDETCEKGDPHAKTRRRRS